MDLTGFRVIDIGGVNIIPVAAPSHRLAGRTNLVCRGQAISSNLFFRNNLRSEPGHWRRQFKNLAHQRPSSAAQAPSRWTRLVRNARTDRSR
jgi:hypothetical protein